MCAPGIICIGWITHVTAIRIGIACDECVRRPGVSDPAISRRVGMATPGPRPLGAIGARPVERAEPPLTGHAAGVPQAPAKTAFFTGASASEKRAEWLQLTA
jgi:hypothetical protein